MAGAGYKLFATGDVLTASEVNTYLMQQAVMVFDDSAARTTALSGVVAEGMLSYLKDTNAVEVYDGSSWVASDDPNAIQNSIVDAKGDLISASADNVPARLAVGNDGESIVADSSTTTGLRYREDYAAGKNKIINGDFNINQRGFTSVTSDQYTFDRWYFALSGATSTCTAETFTLGTAPVAGYESKNFLRVTTTTGNDFCRISQLIESVRTFAGQTVTVSFWAKGTNPTTAGNLKVRMSQIFGTGGSPSAEVSAGQQTFVLTANWTRYSLQFSVPSISGKTLGTNNNDCLVVFFGQGDSISTDSWTLDLWGIQVEEGSVATAFQTATGTLAGELAACMRYAEKVEYTGSTVITVGQAYSTSAAWGGISWTTQKRATPTITQTGTIQALQANTATSGTTFAYSTIGKNNARIDHSSGSGLVAGNACIFQASGDASLLITAEL